MAERTYNIGSLASIVGVPTSTIRYYDRRGLVRPEFRSEGNYRVYRTQAIERLRFIRSALANGFTLEDIGRLLRFRDGKTPACRSVQELITERLGELDSRAEEIHRIQSLLREWLRRCRHSERTGRCQVIDRLADDPPASRATAHRRATKPKNSKKAANI